MATDTGTSGLPERARREPLPLDRLLPPRYVRPPEAEVRAAAKLVAQQLPQRFGPSETVSVAEDVLAWLKSRNHTPAVSEWACWDLIQAGCLTPIHPIEYGEARHLVDDLRDTLPGASTKTMSEVLADARTSYHYHDGAVSKEAWRLAPIRGRIALDCRIVSDPDYCIFSKFESGEFKYGPLEWTWDQTKMAQVAAWSSEQTEVVYNVRHDPRGGRPDPQAAVAKRPARHVISPIAVVTFPPNLPINEPLPATPENVSAEMRWMLNSFEQLQAYLTGDDEVFFFGGDPADKTLKKQAIESLFVYFYCPVFLNQNNPLSRNKLSITQWELAGDPLGCVGPGVFSDSSKDIVDL